MISLLLAKILQKNSGFSARQLEVHVKNLILFLVSLIFYAWGEPIYILLMLFSTVVDYVHGLLVDYCKKRGSFKKARLAVFSSVTINLLLLGFFKYAGIEGLPLPIGISFYTFQTMSYTIDVYRGEAAAQKNIISFGAYVSLFPQLIAGPVVRYKTIASQLEGRSESTDQFSYGITRFVIGLGKKVLFANNIGMLWNQISAMPQNSLSALTAWIGIIAFCFQIYFDFSGYSDMAIGMGNMFGFRFLENFNYPYMSKSITEFWRRWHISLGTWFREYVYIPLGGNRTTKGRHIRNILIVWMLTGIWHGAGWNFFLWGLYFGVLLILEKSVIGKYLVKMPNLIKHLYTMFLVIISWVIFAFDSLPDGMNYIFTMFGRNGILVDNMSLYMISGNALMFLMLSVACTDMPKRIATYLTSRFATKSGTDILCSIAVPAIIAIVFLLSTAYLADASYNPFLYFRF